MQLPELKRRHLDLGLALSLIAGVGSAGGVWLLAPTLAGLFNEPTLSQYLRVFCLAFVVASLSVVPAHWLRRQLRFKQLRLVDLLAYGDRLRHPGHEPRAAWFRRLGRWLQANWRGYRRSPWR